MILVMLSGRLISAAGRPTVSRADALTVTPGVAASTLNRADRRVGGTSGFQSMVVDCSNTLPSALPVGLMSFGMCRARRTETAFIACRHCWSYWAMSIARKAAWLVGMAANCAAVGDQCRATGAAPEGAPPLPFW